MPAQKITKPEILGKAIQLFRQQGYHATSIGQLARHCGIQKAHFYYYFPDGKQQILQEVLESVRTYFLERVYSIAYEKDESPVGKYERVVAKLEKVLLGGKGGCLMANTILELVHQPDFAFIKPVWKAYIEDGIEALAHLYEPVLGSEKARQQAEYFLQDIEGGLILSQLYEDNRFVRAAFERGAQAFVSPKS
ncbi:MAG: TetR/AcrR family transcriptional regulator [Bacteroidota bacterium]